MNLKFVWEVHLKTDPGRLWRYIADTSRLNEAVGLPEWKLSYIPESDGGSHQVSELRYMGWRVRSDEYPFEWIEGCQYEVIRSYQNGPLQRFRMVVFLRPENGGTLLERSHHSRAPLAVAGSADLLGSRLAVAPALRTRLPQDRPVSRGRCRNPIPTDPTTRAVGNATGAESLPHLLRALETSEDEALERMRAFRFADRWGADRLRTLKLFLHAANAGLLDMSWDVIGPRHLRK